MAWNTATDGDDDRYEECEGAEPIPFRCSDEFSFGYVSPRGRQQYYRECDNTLDTVREWLRIGAVRKVFGRQLDAELKYWQDCTEDNRWPWFSENEPPECCRLSAQYAFLLVFADNCEDEGGLIPTETMARRYGDIREMGDCVTRCFRQYRESWHPFLFCLISVENDLKDRKASAEEADRSQVPNGEGADSTTISSDTASVESDQTVQQSPTGEGACGENESSENQTVKRPTLPDNTKLEIIETPAGIFKFTLVDGAPISSFFNGSPTGIKKSSERYLYKLVSHFGSLVTHGDLQGTSSELSATPSLRNAMSDIFRTLKSFDLKFLKLSSRGAYGLGYET